MCRDSMGRLGYVPNWLCADFTMCRVDPVPPCSYANPSLAPAFSKKQECGQWSEVPSSELLESFIIDRLNSKNNGRIK